MTGLFFSVSVIIRVKLMDFKKDRFGLASQYYIRRDLCCRSQIFEIPLFRIPHKVVAIENIYTVKTRRKISYIAEFLQNP